MACTNCTDIRRDIAAALRERDLAAAAREISKGVKQLALDVLAKANRRRKGRRTP